MWRDFLGIESTDDPACWLMPVTDAVTGGAGQLFGGCGLGAAVGLLEELTQRPAAWATAQFVSNAFPGEVVAFDATVVVSGYNFCQARVSGHVDDREVLTVMAALGNKNFDGAGAWRQMPAVAPPERCERRLSFGPDPGGLHTRIDQRIVAGEWGDETNAPTGVTRVWMRIADGASGSTELAGTTVGLAVAADFLPLGLRAALGGRDLFGASLDNTIRYVRRTASEWVLADLQIDELAEGVGHGTVHLWSDDGHLLAVASQTCSVRDFTRTEASS